MQVLAEKIVPDVKKIHLGDNYNRGMNENLFTELSTWLTQAGLAGTPETDIVSVFCDRCVAAGISAPPSSPGMPARDSSGALSQ